MAYDVQKYVRQICKYEDGIWVKCHVVGVAVEAQRLHKVL